MTVINRMRWMVYRIHEKGMEVCLWQDNDHLNRFISEQINTAQYPQLSSLVHLETQSDEEGNMVATLAISADELYQPSVRALLKEDVRLAKELWQTILPTVERGSYMAIKEAFKKAMPYEYRLLRELKDIITHRNLLENI